MILATLCCFFVQLEDVCSLFESYQSGIIGKTKFTGDRNVILKVSVVHSDLNPADILIRLQVLNAQTLNF